MRCLKLVILIATITLQPVFSGLVAADAVSTAAVSPDNTLSIANENNSENLPTTKQEEKLGKSNEPLINKENSNSLPAANDGKTLPRQTAENKTAAKPAEIPPLVPSSPTNASETVDKTTTLPSPVLVENGVVVSAFKTDPKYGYTAIELYNTSDEFFNLGQISLELRYATAEADFVCNAKLRDYLRPKSYLTLYNPNLSHADGALLLAGCPTPNSDALYDKEINVYQAGQLVEAVRINNTDLGKYQNDIWERKGWSKSYRTGVFKTDFRKRATGNMISSDLYRLPPTPTLQIIEILPNPADCATADPNLACYSYVKVKNVGQSPIDLSLYRLRSGNQAVSDSTNNLSKLSGTVLPGKIFVISGKTLHLDKASGTVWLQDANELTTYNNDVMPYEKADSASNKGRSWAYDAKTATWRWATPSPGSEGNDFAPKLNYGKGSLKALSAKPKIKILKPCRDDQYRSEETGRCRSIAKAAAAVLKPCKEGQFRNPETGRCKKIASVDDLPKPCKAGWERNPSTGRCRKIKKASNTLAAYPVQPVTVQQTNPAVWWTIGGLALAGVSYGVWEWRVEIKRGLRKAIRFGRK
ncbi:MAG: hypothetical protein HXL04_00975 [Candidatus Nanosynbacter sp.]|nr:hypothetical protein [Candidatus Nanosynbacter sp.]